MDKDKARERKTLLRRVKRAKVRQDLLVSEYIHYKYFDIYAEAVDFYNELNKQYPSKHDLSKTEEFKFWKIEITAETRKASRLRPTHPSSQPNPFQNLEPLVIPPQAEITISYPNPSEQPQSPDMDSHPNPSEQPQSPDMDSHPNPSEQPQSPDMDSQPSTPNPSEQPQSPDMDSQPSTPNPSEQPQSPDMDSQPSTPNPGEQRNQIYVDNLQLRIPLMQYKAPTKHPTVTTETLEVVTEEILDEDTFQPSLYDELPQELVDKIISELQADPDLRTIFTDIEQQLEFEQLGMDIDIMEDNALQNELEHW